MTNQYIPPWKESNFFTCPHCNINSKIHSINVMNRMDNIFHNIIKTQNIMIMESQKLEKDTITSENFIFQWCGNCKRIIIWSELIVDFLQNEDKINVIYPKSSLATLPNKDISGDNLDIYNQARLIFDISPKAAAVLLRTILENFLREKFMKPDWLLGKILKDKIVEEDLGKDIINFLKKLKNIGNDAAHSARMIYDDDDKKEVEKLFTGINLVFSRLVSDKKEIDSYK